METPFFGGSYQSLSSNMAADRVMNLIPEVMETKQGRQVGGYYSTPGQRAFLTLANHGFQSVGGSIRGLYASLPSQIVACYGNQVVTIDINQNVTLLGLLKTATGPVSIIGNGKQYAVFDGFQGYSWSAGTWAPITTLQAAPAFGAFQDGFGLCNQVGTNVFFQSNLNDLTTWDALNYSSADSEPSAIIGMVSFYRQIWIFKKNTTEIWNNAGANGFAFQRMQGAFLQVGCLAPASIAVSVDRIFWLGQNQIGSLSVFMNDGYTALPVSTHPVEYAILSYMQATQRGAQDAVAFIYSQGGHTFYVLTFPGGNATWVYDLKTRLWQERGEFINGTYNRWDPSTYVFYNGMHIVGSSSGQQLSVLDLTYANDDVPGLTQSYSAKRWMRRWRATSKPAPMPMRYSSLRLDMQTGVPIELPA